MQSTPEQDQSTLLQRVTVRVPSALRAVAGGKATVTVGVCPGTPGSVMLADVLACLESVYPGVHHGVLDEQGAVRRHVNLFVGAENIRLGDGLATPVPPGVEVWIIPAVSGG